MPRSEGEEDQKGLEDEKTAKPPTKLKNPKLDLFKDRKF